MKERLIKITPIVAMIPAVIYFCSCQRTYDSNNIPGSSTDGTKQDEIYSKSDNVRTEATGTVSTDSTQNGQMLPANSTGAPHTNGKTTQ